MMTRTACALVSFLFLSCATTAPPASDAPSLPRSIILLIADGAGSSHFTVGRMVRGEDFQIGRLPYSGLVATGPLEDSIVTDSAASATALATGVRTKYVHVGVDGSGAPQLTALELAEQRGKATGLVTTANFWDGTAAAFAAHTPSRYATDVIIPQMLASGAEVIIGGGAARFGVEGRASLEEVADAAGYTLARTADELTAASGERLLGVFTTGPEEGDFPGARLPVLARIAIERLSRDPDGFFVMIEHEGTDGASHKNMTAEFIASMISFDEAVGVALEYAETRPDVLVIATADHETGGLRIHPEKGMEMQLAWGTKGHTGAAVPIFAKGPGAEMFTGFLDADEVGRRLHRLLGR